MRQTCILLLALAAVLGVVACEAESPRETATTFSVSVDTVAGVERILNEGPPPELRFEEVLRLGTVMGRGPEEFGRIRSLTADGDGNVYVADNIAQEIRVFDREGQHLRTIGRSGRGPGEFANLYSLAWLGGRLAAMDPNNVRIGLLSTEGEWIDQIQHHPITGTAMDARLHPLGEDGFYAPVIGRSGGRVPFVRFTVAGPPDTIHHPTPPDDAPTYGVLCQRPRAIQSITVPEAPALTFAFPPEGERIAVSWTDRMRIATVTGGGDTIRIVAHDSEPLPYPDSLWEEAREPYDEMRRRHPESECEPSTLRRPRYRAALRHILFDAAGWMWVEAVTEEGFAWDVFDEHGRLRGRGQAPERYAGIPPYARDGVLYQVETDELDVQYVAAYRLTDSS